MNTKLRISQFLIAAWVLASSAIAALGQEGEAPEMEGSPPWYAILFTVIGVAVFSLVVFKKSGRTHLD
ncbi:MAG: hypothetical protein ACOC93_02230 [Planctomycetota bacterium]